jgi:hypothetical protein
METWNFATAIYVMNSHNQFAILDRRKMANDIRAAGAQHTWA